jgi:hypothetical protein
VRNHLEDDRCGKAPRAASLPKRPDRDPIAARPEVHVEVSALKLRVSKSARAGENRFPDLDSCDRTTV